MAADAPLANAMRLRNQLQAVYRLDPLRNEEEVRVKIEDLNEHIVCILCAGYFVDATTITECLHTFCKSCIVKYLQTSKHCPMCNVKIHETQPLINLKLDRVMQEIVFKLVPGLQQNEEQRIKEFSQTRGLDRIVQSEEFNGPQAVQATCRTADLSRAHLYRHDELVCLHLDSYCSSLGQAEGVIPLQQKYVRCSARAQVYQLRKVLARKLGLETPEQVLVFFKDEVLPDEMTMKQVWRSRWYSKPLPLQLLYGLHKSFRI
uniref:Polycomb group RING finger protein 1 n=1 Tax=Eptatretus burgeri TaxID=7764 RepID=A0A8C4QNA6_EPTBU